MIASYVEKLHSFFVCMFCSLSLDCPVWPSCPETRSDYQAGLEVKDPFASDSVLPDALLSLGFRDKRMLPQDWAEFCLLRQCKQMLGLWA